MRNLKNQILIKKRQNLKINLKVKPRGDDEEKYFISAKKSDLCQSSKKDYLISIYEVLKFNLASGRPSKDWNSFWFCWDS